MKKKRAQEREPKRKKTRSRTASDGGDAAESLLLLLLDLIPDAEAVGIVSGYRESVGLSDPFDDKDIKENLPNAAQGIRMLSYQHGDGSKGMLAEFLVDAVLCKAGFYHELKKRGFAVPDEAFEESPPGHDDGYCAGLLMRQLQDAALSGDGSFFRVLADMIERNYADPVNRTHPVAFALRAKVELEREGRPITKKAVSERAEVQNATWNLESRGELVTAEKIARERAGIKWRWKRIWKSHPDLALIPRESRGKSGK